MLFLFLIWGSPRPWELPRLSRGHCAEWRSEIIRADPRGPMGFPKLPEKKVVIEEGRHGISRPGAARIALDGNRWGVVPIGGGLNSNSQLGASAKTKHPKCISGGKNGRNRRGKS